ncbi:MAG: PAS domain S-box protein [Bacteroidales bacterium]|nr:PAS domain S-box protein [Bacteroidales bacterium]
METLIDNTTFTILLIDDDPHIRETVTEVLKGAGFHPISFDNFKDAISYLSNHRVDVVIVDLFFYGVFQESLFKELSSYAMEIPIIVYTAFSSLQTAKQALEARFFAYVEKEANPDQLLKEIHRAIYYKHKVEKDYLESLLKKRTRELEVEVTRRRESEKTLRLSEEKYRLMVKAMPAVVFLTDAKGNLQYMSPYATILTGYSLQDLTLEKMLKLLPSHLYHKILFQLKKMILWTSKGYFFEIKETVSFVSAHGEKKYAELVVKPIFDKGKCIAFHGILRDITSEMVSKLGLEETLLELSTLYESISDYIFILDKEYRIYRLNAPALEFLRKHHSDLGEVYQKKWGEVIRCINDLLSSEGCGTHEECENCSIRNFLNRVDNAGIREKIEFVFSSEKQHYLFYFIAFGRLIRIKEKEFIFLSLTDITELQKTNDQLQRLHQQFQSLVDNIQEGLLLLDLNTNQVLFSNEKLYELFEINRKKIHLDPFTWLTKVRGKPNLKDEIKIFFENHEITLQSTFEYLNKNCLKSILLTAIKMTFEERKQVMFIFSDVSHIKKDVIKDMRIWAEAELAERKKLARKIHDEISPIVGLLTSSCSVIEGSIQEKHKELFLRFKRNLQVLHKSLYDISHQLEEQWEAFSLKEALDQYVDELTQTKAIRVHIDIKTDIDSLLYKKNLYALTLELIHNTLKHAQAGNIYIELLPFENFILYRYRDDGIGFEFDKVKKSGKGLGLKHIEERVREMGGTLEFVTSPGQGIELNVYLLKDT